MFLLFQKILFPADFFAVHKKDCMHFAANLKENLRLELNLRLFFLFVFCREYLHYLNLVLRLISENVDKDDQLVLSKDGVLSVEDFASADFIKENNVTISETPGDFVGGVMLIGKSCDKDLTFEAVIESKKDLLASEVAKRLF